MARPSRATWGVLALVLVAALVRGPLHAVTFGLPVSNDDAILLLMARHVLQGELATTLWNQPYNGALDAYLLAPSPRCFGHHPGFRLYEALCAVLLALCAGLLARRVAGPRRGLGGRAPRGLGHAVHGAHDRHRSAAQLPDASRHRLPAARGSAHSTARRAVGSACERCSASASSAGSRCGTPRSPSRPSWGWRRACSSPAVRPARPRRARALLGFAVGASPLVVARVIGASGASVVTAASAVTAIRPRWLWMSGLRTWRRPSSPSSAFASPWWWTGPRRPRCPPPSWLCRWASAWGRGRRRRLAPRAAARGLGLGPRRRLRSQPPHRPRRAALPLRSQRARCSPSRGSAWRVFGDRRPPRPPPFWPRMLVPWGLGDRAARAHLARSRPTRSGSGRCRRSTRRSRPCAATASAAPTRAFSSRAGSRSSREAT